VFDSLSQHINSCGYTVVEVNRFSAAFQNILRYPRQAIESLEAAVDEINAAISSRLWKLLKNKLGFVAFLHLIRNTYLLGKGTTTRCKNAHIEIVITCPSQLVIGNEFNFVISTY